MFIIHPVFKKTIYLSTLFVLMLILASCAPALPENEGVSSPGTPVVEMTPTPVLPTPEPPTVLYDDVSFSFGADIASNWTVEFVPQGPGSATGAGPVEHTDPEHIIFSLENYTLYPLNPNSLHLPSVYIYPAVEMSNQNPIAAARIADLKIFLDSPPENLLDQTEAIPFLPLYNAAQVFHTQVKFLDFQNGKGVRFLTMYSQGPMPIVNAGLFYTFQGLTNDGEYYVAVTLPVHNPILRIDANEAFDADGDAFMTDPWNYLTGMAEQLDRQASNTFLPDLSALDAMIETLLVRP